jgi:hypothetical protein
MAKRRSSILRSLGKIFDIKQVTEIENDSAVREYRSISDKEFGNMFKSVYTPNPNRLSPGFDPQNIPSMIEPITRELIDRRMDNEKLCLLAPEVNQAASITIPSILSPNDFSSNVFSLIIKGGNESEGVKKKIVDLLNTHFQDEMDLHIKLSDWIEDAMFKVGCKPILLLPTSFIADMKKDIASIESINEYTNKLDKEINASTESLNLDLKRKNNFSVKEDDVIDKVFSTKVFDNIPNNNGVDAKLSIRSQLKPSVDKLFKHFNDKKLLSFSTDPRIVLSDNIKMMASTEAIDKKILDKIDTSFSISYRNQSEYQTKTNDQLVGYKYAPYIDLSQYVLNNKIGDYPAMIELPGESVIPIIVEGSPSIHIGYFITISENGAPLSINNDSFGELISSTYGSQKINKLFNAYYGSSSLSIQQKLAADAKFEILNSIYDSYIYNILKSKLTDIGLNNHRIELSDSVTRVMFSRLLKGAETRIVFVPKKLMNYFAFKYNDDGTGRSKIEDIKFPLSLKMTLVITRLISLIESSINRRTLNISLDDTVGNPLELLRMIKKDILGNKAYGLSYDPSTIIKTVQEKGLTIVPDKIPGVESFSINESGNNVDYPKPDDAILEEINNMYMLSLDVPPSALNRLGEEEFSRSVASNNIFYSNKICSYQRITCDFMTNLIQSYIQFSKNLQKSITDILDKEPIESGEESIKESNPAVESVKGDTDDLKEDQELKPQDRLKEIINNIRFTLPAPNLVHDKAGFEEINEYITIISTILDNLYPDEMVANTELGEAIKVLRASLKRNILQEHISKNTLLSSINFDGLSDINITDSVSVTQKMLNLKNALDNVVKVLSNGEDTESSGWS